MRACEASSTVTQYPIVRELGQRRYRNAWIDTLTARPAKRLRNDRSPWVVEAHEGWAGISAGVSDLSEPLRSRVSFHDDLGDGQSARWLLRNDTFAGNLGLFRPANVRVQPGTGLSLAVVQESLGVRNFSAASISSRSPFLYGRFEVTLQATSVSGLVTGFFLHRDSPRQEIDVEITGNRPDRLLVNVFYNPGGEGAKFDYGYRERPRPFRWGSTRQKPCTGLRLHGIHARFGGSSMANSFTFVPHGTRLPFRISL